MLHSRCPARSQSPFSALGVLCLGLLFSQCESSSSGDGTPPTPPNTLIPASAVTITEANTTVTVTIQRSNPNGLAISVDYTTSDGSAIAPVDYKKTSGTLNWAAGDNSDKTIGIDIFDDNWFEGVEQFRLDFTNAQGATLAVPSTTVFLIDDETKAASTDQVQHLVYRFGGAQAVAAVGDVDGDSVTDFLVGDGQALNKGGVVDLRSGAKGTLLKQFLGATGEQLGSSVCGLGDVDGDGSGDYAMAVSGLENWAVRVISGKAGTQLRELKGSSKGVWTAMVVAAADDIDSDGTPDILVGLPQAAPAFGLVQIYSGKDGTPLRTLSDGKGGASFGSAIAGLGDLNGDGFGDVAVGAPGENASAGNDGAVYLLSGKTGGQIGHLTGGSLDARFGTAVVSVGDVDGDRTNDFLVGAPGARQSSGETQVFSGSSANSLFTFRGENSQSGHGSSAAAAGDVNGDGVPDLLIGEPGDLQAGTGVGVVRVHSGKNGALLFRFGGTSTHTNFGALISTAGDVNGDGFSDLLLGSAKELVLLSGAAMSLASDAHELSLEQGGAIVLNLAADQAFRSLNYVIAGAFGTTPGSSVGGIKIPLNSDAWFDFSLRMFLLPGFQQMHGRLDSKGEARATLTFPKAAGAAGIGVTIYHAFVIIDDSGKFRAASNAIPLTFLK